MKITRRSFEADVPTSSMADIAFLLIVFFMLTAVFSSKAGITFLLPASQPADAAEEAIFIHLHPNGFFSLDGRDYSVEQASVVFDYVYEKTQINPNKPIILLTDAEAQYGHMVRIMDQLKRVEAGSDSPLDITLPNKREREMIVRAL